MLLLSLAFGCSKPSPAGRPEKAKTEEVSAEQLSAQLSPIAEKFAACEKEGKAWIPDGLVDSVGTCDEKLVKLCCNEEGVKARFPAAASLIEAKIKSADQDGYRVYQCSKRGDEYVIHLARYADKRASHREILVGGLEITAGDGKPCPIDIVAVLSGGSSTEPADDPQYTKVIAPLVVAKCGGRSCHDSANTYPIPLAGKKSALVDNAKAIITALENGSMPVGREMSDAEKKQLSDYCATLDSAAE